MLEQASVQLANFSVIPEITRVIDQSNRNRVQREQLKEMIEEIESEWATLDPSNSTFFRDLLDNEASRFVRKYNVVSAGFREILITDRFGRLVATTNKTTDYFQADEEWWQRSYLQGAGQRFISDMVFDESANTYGMEVSEPIRNPATGEVTGVVKGLLDSAWVRGLIESMFPDADARTFLFRSDGTIIWGPYLESHYRFSEEYRRALESSDRAVSVSDRGQRELLGVPGFRLREKLPELDWHMAVHVPYDRFFAPFDKLRIWYLYALLFVVGGVLLMAMIFTWILQKPVIEAEPHLERI